MEDPAATKEILLQEIRNFRFEKKEKMEEQNQESYYNKLYSFL